MVVDSRMLPEGFPRGRGRLCRRDRNGYRGQCVIRTYVERMADITIGVAPCVGLCTTRGLWNSATGGGRPGDQPAAAAGAEPLLDEPLLDESLLDDEESEPGDVDDPEEDSEEPFEPLSDLPLSDLPLSDLLDSSVDSDWTEPVRLSVR